jgi:hypothetical protein
VLTSTYFNRRGLTLPIDGSCESELSMKGLLPDKLIIGDWHQESIKTVAEIEEKTDEEGLDEKEDNNENVFFCWA